GFSMLDHAQYELADRLTKITLEWFVPENASIARRAIAATGPDLVSLFAYLITPIAQATLMPIALGLALVCVSRWLDSRRWKDLGHEFIIEAEVQCPVQGRGGAVGAAVTEA